VPVPGGPMAKFLTLYKFSAEAIGRFSTKSADRVTVARDLVEALGGRLESYYWMFGQYDGLVIMELPDSKSAAAVSMAVAGSGAFSSYETHELIEASDISGIAEKARQINFQPPGT
jgi:uncharacterized protein with GYD domain